MNPFLAKFSDHTPCLVSPHQQATFESCLHQASVMFSQMQAEFAADKAAVQMQDDFWFAANDWRAAYRPYVVKDGILLIPVKGVLLDDFPYALGSWATGYYYIQKAFERGLTDPEVTKIALMCDTPGGMVAGCFDLVDKMYEARGTKPVWGFAHESAYSAGYAVISVADKIYVSRTGGVGSIGVVTSHVDVSARLAKDGVKVTFIFAGDHKVDGNPYEPLPEKVKVRIQSRIDDLYSTFVSTMARNRSMDEQAIRDTEALTFTATEALSNGLADAIGSRDDALADFSASLTSEGDDNMADITQADLDNARAEGVTAGKTEGHALGMTAQKDRINAILGGEPAKERPQAALAAALTTDMTADQASAFLAILPAEKAAAPAAPAAAAPAASAETVGGGTVAMLGAMANGDQPNVGAGGAPAAENANGEQPSRAEKALAYVKGPKKAT